jgi:type IV secretion system protein VirB10
MSFLRYILLGVMSTLCVCAVWGIPMKKELPKDLYSYELQTPDPIPEEPAEPALEEHEETVELPQEEAAPTEDLADMEEIRVLQQRLNILKKRRESVERLNDLPAEEERRTQPKDMDYGLESDVLGYPVDRFKFITADRYIPCITENSINSELPGRVIVVVERNVFAPKGRNIVIPKGARMICGYEKTKAGQTRLSLKCKRMITPNGAHMILSEITASDVMGRGGVAAYVDNRFAEQFGAALTVAAIEGGINLGRSWLSKNELFAMLNNPSAGATQHDSAFVKIINKMLEKNANLDPIIMVPSGTRVLMIPAKDIIMRTAEGEGDKQHDE